MKNNNPILDHHDFSFQSLFRMASAEALAKLETKAVAAEKLIELLRQQISQVSVN